MGIHWVIVITVLIIFIQVGLVSKWGLKNIYYTRYFSEEAVFEGEEMEMVEEIINKKLLPIPWLRLESRFHTNLQFQHQSNLDIVDEIFHRSMFSLMPYQKIRRRHRITCKKRGFYHQKTVSLTIGDLLGISIYKKKLNVTTQILVYPKLIPLKEIPLPYTSWNGDVVVRRWILDDPFINAGIREYTYGDPMKRVNWNATARVGSLQVSKKDYTADHQLLIYLNFDLTDDVWKSIEDEDLIEKGISYAASIAQSTISQGINTGFGCNSYIREPDEKVRSVKDSVRIEARSGKQHLYFLLNTLAKLKMDRSRNFNHFLKEDIDREIRNKDILLITAYVSEQVQERIEELKRLGNSVEILWLEKEGKRQGDREEEGDVSVL